MKLDSHPIRMEDETGGKGMPRKEHLRSQEEKGKKKRRKKI